MGSQSPAKASCLCASVPALCPVTHCLGAGASLSLINGSQHCPGENPLPAVASWPFERTSAPSPTPHHGVWFCFPKTSAPGRPWAEKECRAWEV